MKFGVKKKIIVTGSEGLVGKTLVKQLSKSFSVVKVDLKLGHDLLDEKNVIQIMKSFLGEVQGQG